MKSFKIMESKIIYNKNERTLEFLSPRYPAIPLIKFTENFDGTLLIDSIDYFELQKLLKGLK